MRRTMVRRGLESCVSYGAPAPANRCVMYTSSKQALDSDVQWRAITIQAKEAALRRYEAEMSH